jgi:hypothetical protein
MVVGHACVRARAGHERVSGQDLDHAAGAADLCSLADVREALELPATETSRDTLILALIPAASVAIMKEAEREFAPMSTATRRFRVRPDKHVDGYYLVDFAPYDLRAATTVTLHPEQVGVATPLTYLYDYALDPEPSRDGVYTRLKIHYSAQIGQSTVAQRFAFAYVDVAGTWGFPSVPSDVATICTNVIKAWMRKDISAFGFGAGDVPGVSPRVMASLRLPKWAKDDLNRYRRRIAF